MSPFLPSSSSSSANTTRPSRLHARSRRRRKKDGGHTPSRFSPREIRRHLFHHDSHEGQADGGAEAGHNRTASGGLKGALKRRGRPGHRKSVTIEEPRQESARGGATSDTGTVRIGKKEGDVDDDTWVTVGSHSGEHYGQYLVVPGEPAHQAVQPVPKVVVPETVQGPHDRNQHQHRHTRTVSRDDYLTARGANPRTGVVSPSITTSSNRTSTDNEVHHGKPKRQPSMAKWRTKGNEWVSIDADEDTPMPSPEAKEKETQGGPKHSPTADQRAQDYITLLEDAGVSMSKLEDRFVVDMPSARDPQPPSMTNQQIHDFQQAVARYRHHGGQLVDPNVPPTPRVETPQGPSTPRRRLSKKFPAHFMGRESRWRDPLPVSYNANPRPEAHEHVHFARPPEGHDCARMGQRSQHAPIQMAGQPFLGQQEARENQKSPLFQSLNALLFRSPPSMKDTRMSDAIEGERPQETSTQNVDNEENHIRNLLQRRSATNMQKLVLDVPMRIPILEQFKRENVNTTITTTSTMIRRKPVPQRHPDPSIIDLPGGIPRGPGYASPYSCPYLPTGQSIGPRIEHIGDDVLEMRAGNRGQRRGPGQQSGGNRAGVRGNAGYAPEIPRKASRRVQGCDKSSSAPCDSNKTPSREGSVRRREDQTGPLNFATRLHVVIVAATLLSLDVVTYLCDSFRAILRLDAGDASNEATGQSDGNGEAENLEEKDDSMAEVPRVPGWTAVLLDVFAAIALMLLVERIIECVHDLGGWAGLAVAMGT